MKHFGAAGDHEYCLCLMDGINIEEEEKKQQEKNQQELEATRQKIGSLHSSVQLPPGQYLKINLPGNVYQTQKKNNSR